MSARPYRIKSVATLGFGAECPFGNCGDFLDFLRLGNVFFKTPKSDEIGASDYIGCFCCNYFKVDGSFFVKECSRFGFTQFS